MTKDNLFPYSPRPEYLSEESKKELEQELDILIKKKRREIAMRLEESIDLGDISENSEYQQAKEEQLMNERRIAELEDLLGRAVVISRQEKIVRDKVGLGCIVVLTKKGEELIYEYEIVGSEEADPVLKKISHMSPLGVSLMGKKKGETTAVLTPMGKISYTIIDIK